MAFRAGMTEDEFWDSTIKSVLLRLSAKQEESYEEWQRTRFESYVLYCTVTPSDKRVPIYKFLELEGDPSEEELRKIEQEAIEQRNNEVVELYEQMKPYL